MEESAFKVGDPAIKNGMIVFILQVQKQQERGWIYEINYSQENMCLGKWQSGGCSFWWNESELKKPEGLLLIKAELWRRWRDRASLEEQLRLNNEEAEKLQFALNYVYPDQKTEVAE